MSVYGAKWVAVDLDNLAHNCRKVRALIGPTVQFLAVVKADGYGHGAVETAHTALANGADRLGVFDLNEAAEIRSAGLDSPVLVFCPPERDEAEQVLQLGVDITLNDIESAREIGHLAHMSGALVRTHIKVDTGFHRFGLRPADVPQFIAALHEIKGLVVEGLYTHFASHDLGAMQRQLRDFRQLVNHLEEKSLKPPYVHAANSAGTATLTDAHLDMVRVGNLVYGWGPSRLGLLPAWELRAVVKMIRNLERGERVGYGGDFKARRSMRAAVLPLGLADGLMMDPIRPVFTGSDLVRGLLKSAVRGVRSLSGESRVTFDRKEAPFVGRVGMQHCVVDVSGLDVQEGDVAAVQCRVTAVPQHVPRIYYRNNEPVTLRRMGVTQPLQPGKTEGREEVS